MVCCCFCALPFWGLQSFYKTMQGLVHTTGKNTIIFNTYCATCRSPAACDLVYQTGLFYVKPYQQEVSS